MEYLEIAYFMATVQHTNANAILENCNFYENNFLFAGFNGRDSENYPFTNLINNYTNRQS